jgi:hypothetical protein
MTATFWSLYAPVLVIVFALALCVAQFHPIRYWRWKRMRREMAQLEDQFVTGLWQKFYADADAHRREQLDNAATSQDRYSRRLH